MLLCCDITDGTIRTNYFLSSQGAVYGCGGFFWSFFYNVMNLFKGVRIFLKFIFVFSSVLGVFSCHNGECYKLELNTDVARY